MGVTTRWIAEYGESSGYDCMTAAFLILNAEGRTIAAVDLSHFGQSGSADPTPEQILKAATVAKLITKAPELRAALERLADRVERIELQDGSTPDTLEARALLAEVDGEPFSNDGH